MKKLIVRNKHVIRNNGIDWRTTIKDKDYNTDDNDTLVQAE